MRLLVPEGRPLDPTALRRLYSYPDPVPVRGYVRANMVASVDGSVAGVDGRSGSISSPPDRKVFSVLRGLADVVLVGAGTARAEGYRALLPKPEFAELRAALGQQPVPCMAVVTASGDVPSNLLRHRGRRDGSWRVLVLTSRSLDPQRVSALTDALGADSVVVAGNERVDPAVALQALVDRGLPRVLCEGGPTLLAGVAAAGCLDELCQTTAPVVAGGDAGRLLSNVVVPVERSRLELAHLIEADGTLLARWLVG